MFTDKWKKRIMHTGRTLLYILAVLYLLGLYENISSMRDSISSIESDVGSIQSDVSSIQSDVSSIESNTR